MPDITFSSQGAQVWVLFSVCLTTLPHAVSQENKAQVGLSPSSCNLHLAFKLLNNQDQRADQESVRNRENLEELYFWESKMALQLRAAKWVLR